MSDLDEFKLVRLLGRGGMGEVFLGHDTVLDRPVAIKLIGSHDPDAISRDRFLTEARAIARLSHPNVVAIYRVGTTGDGRPFLVQELIRGGGLDRLPRPLPWRQLCELAVGVARGLETAHRRGILHRDIKPANVMIDDRGTPRLLDFGLAKLTATSQPPFAPPREVGADAVAETLDGPVAARSTELALSVPPAHDPRPTLTRPGALLGTPRYCAPEIWRGEQATVRSDLYSFGAMLYELATDVPPFPDRDVESLERAVLAGGARPLVELAPELPRPIARAIERCLALDPADRPHSVAEVLHELEAVLVDAPAVPDGNPYRGLRAFDAEHRGLFFGRGADISVLVDRLRTESLVVITGDSGIGKSSVCHAGVAPAVVAGALADNRRWRTVAIVPGKRPWDAVCDALGVAANETEVVRAIEPGVLIVIDQLEELVTVAEPTQAARVAGLLAAIADGPPGVKAVVAVRGDFLTRVAALPGLGDSIARGLHLLRVLSDFDLRDAICGPARACGVAFETEEMIDSLVAAVAGNVGALPLLQFTLAELWTARDRDRDVIPERALTDLGGVAGALARRADAVLLLLAAEQRTAARHILLRLVTPAHTRAVRERDELLAGESSATALEALVRGRLVSARDTIDGAASYELAHEALITSWGTLAGWLAEAAGSIVVRERLIASSTEWDRAGRAPDLLWSRRQLAELRDDDVASKEQPFVAASRRRIRRALIARIAAIVALPLLALGIFGAVRFDATRKRDRAIAERAAVATTSEQAARAAAARATTARTSAFAAFDRGEKSDGERLWSEARGEADRAQRAYRDAAAELEAAHLVGGDVRDQMTAVLWANAELAESEYSTERVDDLLRRLETYDPDRVAAWNRPAHLVIEADRPATIAVHARARAPGKVIAGGFQSEPALVRSHATRVEGSLAPGSYVAVITPDDGVPIRDPILLARGETLVRTHAIPPAAPAQMVYVPRGRFLFGSAQDDEQRKNYLHTDPLHTTKLPAYWIGRTEVTFADWLIYLRALPPEERRIRTPKSNTGSVMELEDHGGRYTLVAKIASEPYRAVEAEPLIYPKRPEADRALVWEHLPVTGVSWNDALAYAQWLDESGRLPHARLCTVREWEHAARGADGRTFPHGDALDPADANFDLTYKRDTSAWGPDEVGSHPASDSPFGVSDLAGNVWELVIGPEGEPWLKGGSWYHSSRSAVSANRDISAADQRDLRTGIRLCADAAR